MTTTPEQVNARFPLPKFTSNMGLEPVADSVATYVQALTLGQVAAALEELGCLSSDKQYRLHAERLAAELRAMQGSLAAMSEATG
jgi:hypothetical protein